MVRMQKIQRMKIVMMIHQKTDNVLRQEGMELLIEHLGNVDAERFVSLMIREPFDYTEWRQDHLEDEDESSPNPPFHAGFE